MKILNDVKLDFSDVLIVPKRSTLDSRSKVTLDRLYTFKHSKRTYSGTPLLASNMDHVGTMAMADAFLPYNMGVALHKFYPVDKLIAYYQRTVVETPEQPPFVDRFNPFVFYTMGITDADLAKFQRVQLGLSSSRQILAVCIDVANGYSRKFVSFVEMMREKYPELCIMAGNVVTGDMVYDLLERGADIVKIGIGSGSVCTTRKVTGIGYPQLSAIIECQDAAHGAGGLICGDGGITCPGDLVKAFAAGADFVMCGGILAGHQECEGEIINGKIKSGIQERLESRRRDWKQSNNTHFTVMVGEKEYVITFDEMGNVVWGNPNIIPFEAYSNPQEMKMKFYGMSSADAMDKHYGGKADYRASEGKAVLVDFKGPVKDTIETYLGGLRSACTYTGARRLKDLSKCSTFIKVNHQLNNIFGGTQ